MAAAKNTEKRFDLPVAARGHADCGIDLLGIALFSDHGNMQIEGLFFGFLLGGVNWIAGIIYSLKLQVRLAFGRVWCGWACWFGMIFDSAADPYSRSRRKGVWN